MNLTAPMRAALTQAQHAPLRRPRPPTGPGPWPAHPSTLRALERHDLLERRGLRNRHGHPVTTWTITPAGRKALQPREIFRRQSVVYLGRAVPGTAAGVAGRGEFTTSKRYAVDPLPVIDPDTLDEAWTQLAEERRAAALDRRERARRTRAA